MWVVTRVQPFLDGAFEQGFALGYQYRTFRHRFTLMATNELGSTAVHVLGGDYEHSATYPGGEIRGQLQRPEKAAAPMRPQY